MFPDGLKAPTPLRIYTLGRFDLVIDDQPVRFKGRAPIRSLELLGALISAGGRGVSAGSLSDRLWPDADGFDAYRAFTTTLHRLRRLLRYPEAVRLWGGQLTLDPQLCQVDVWAFERALRAARGQDEIEAALSLYHGPFMAAFTNPWAVETRDRLRQLIQRAEQRDHGRAFVRSGISPAFAL